MSFLGIEIARRSLTVHQRAMATTAHNIANVNTPGYSRQEAVLQTTLALSYPAVNSPRPGTLGTGVTVFEIIRYRDAYLDRQVRDAKAASGYAAGMETALQRVEAVFPEPSDFGIQGQLGSFFNAWHYLAQDSQNAGSRAAVKGAAQTLANSLNIAQHSLNDIRRDLVGSDPPILGERSLFSDQVRQINFIGEQIAQLNKEIAYQRTAGANPNDLLDRREALLEQLSVLADVSVTVTSGELDVISVSVYGEVLVDGNGYKNPGFGYAELTVENAQNVVIGKTRGVLAGTWAAAERIDAYLIDLGALRDALAGSVNHALGDVAFFAVNSGVISLGDDAESALVGIAPKQAWAVAQLRETKVVPWDPDNPGLITLETSYQNLVTLIGSDLNVAQRDLANVNAILSQVQFLRESVSGVNLDEELTKMMQYQYGYQAAARVLTIMDELLDTLINRMM